MTRSIAPLTALVTGASSGLGEAAAKRLAAGGHRLILTSENEPDLIKAAEACRSCGASAVDTFVFDLTDPAAPDRLHRACAERGAAVDILINCAGIYLPIERELSDPACVERIINLHVLAVTKLCLLFGREMVARRRGWILNVSSIASMFPDPASLTYGPSKRYLLAFSDAIHCEWKPCNVKVTCLTPGGIKTNFFSANEVYIPPMIRRTLISADACAAAALKALFKGKRRCTPGLFGKLQLLLLRLFSRPATYPLIKKSYFSMKQKRA